MGIEFMGETATNDAEEENGGLYVAREDVIFADNSAPNLNYGTKVQFQVYKSEKGLGACRVMNEDGSAYEYKRSTKRKMNTKGELIKRARSKRVKLFVTKVTLLTKRLHVHFVSIS